MSKQHLHRQIQLVRAAGCASMQVVRVMTWNLWWRFGPWQERLEAIVAVVAAEQPDVLFLQEVWADGDDSAAGRIAASLGYHVAMSDDPFRDRRGDRASFHNAIVSRWPLLEVESHPLPRADGLAGHRRALTAVVDAPHGRWPVLCTHLDHRFDESAVREAQCRAVLDLVAARRGDPEHDRPVIVGGDFNAVPDSDEIRLLTGRRAAPVPGLVLSDCWEHVGNDDGATWRRDNPYQAATAWPNRRLDYVFVSWPRPKPIGNPVRAWLAGCASVDMGGADPVTPSDHAAVVVDLVTT
jgi:endonuclease/exonuclease/phosphatase family metal-dependent hydrolase